MLGPGDVVPFAGTDAELLENRKRHVWSKEPVTHGVCGAGKSITRSDYKCGEELRFGKDEYLYLSRMPRSRVLD